MVGSQTTMSKHKGSITEIKFLLLCLENHIGVSQPYGDNNAYDFIIDQGGRLYRIQVKGTYRQKQKSGHYRINILSRTKRKKKVHYQEVDFFAFYIQECDVWYIIPQSRLKGDAVDLRPNGRSVMNKYLIQGTIVPDLQTWGT